MLICTNNLVEIITFVFIIDILSQVLIKDVYASRRYSIYNLIADMGLFLIMAMLKGKLETLETEKTEVETNYANVQTECETVKTELETVKSDYEVVKTKLDEIEPKYNDYVQAEEQRHIDEVNAQKEHQKMYCDLNKVQDENKKNFNLIINSYKFRLIQLCKTHLRDESITQDEFDQVSEMYKLYHGLGGNGQAQEYYEKVLELPIRD
jgi:hypothetical protein